MNRIEDIRNKKIFVYDLEFIETYNIPKHARYGTYPFYALKPGNGFVVL